MFRFRTALLSTALAAVLAFAIHPAQASEQGAKRLETLFTGLISDNAASLKSGGNTLETEGVVKVIETGGLYNVSLPKMTVRHPDMSRLEIGAATVTAQDSGTDGEWKASMQFPAAIDYIDPTGKTAVTSTIGKQEFSGLLNEKLRAFTTVDAHVRDVRVIDNAHNARTLMDGIDLTVDLKEKTPGMRSGPFKLEISRLSFSFEDGGSTTVGKINIDADILGIGQNSNMEGGSVSVLPANPGIFDMFSLYFGAGKSGIDSTVSAHDIMIKSPVNGTTDIADSRLRFAVTNFRGQNADLIIDAGFNGMRSDRPQLGIASLAPEHLRFDFMVGSLPYNQIFGIVKELGPAGLRTPLGALVIMGKLPTLFSAAGSEVRMRDSGFGNDKYEVKLDGAFHAEPASPIYTAGKAHGEVTGFPFIIDTLTTASNNPKLDPATRQRTQGMLGNLTVMQMVGQQKGENTRVYDIELTKEGKAMLNGTDLSTLLGAVNPAPAKPQ